MIPAEICFLAKLVIFLKFFLVETFQTYTLVQKMSDIQPQLLPALYVFNYLLEVVVGVEREGVRIILMKVTLGMVICFSHFNAVLPPGISYGVRGIFYPYNNPMRKVRHLTSHQMVTGPGALRKILG